jgi:hypothetical protein
MPVTDYHSVGYPAFKNQSRVASINLRWGCCRRCLGDKGVSTNPCPSKGCDVGPCRDTTVSKSPPDEFP